MNEVLIVSNSNNNFDDNIKKFVFDSVNAIKDKSSVFLFKDDSNLYNLLNEMSDVACIDCIVSSADKMIRDGASNIHHTSNKEESCLRFISSDDKSRILRKFPIVRKDLCYDDIEFKTQRLSTLNKRIKYCMNLVASRFSYIIFIESDRQSNFVNSIVPSYGDGRFIVKYNEKTHTPIMYVGGSEVPFEHFQRAFTM